MARDYKKEYANYQGKPEQIKNRALRNAARAKLMKEGVVHKGDNKDVDHRTELSHGGSNARSNLKAVPRGSNRRYNRDSRGRPV